MVVVTDQEQASGSQEQDSFTLEPYGGHLGAPLSVPYDSVTVRLPDKYIDSAHNSFTDDEHLTQETTLVATTAAY